MGSWKGEGKLKGRERGWREGKGKEVGGVFFSKLNYMQCRRDRQGEWAGIF